MTNSEILISKNKLDWMPPGSKNGIKFNPGGGIPFGPPAYFTEYDISEREFLIHNQQIEFQEISKPTLVPSYKRYLIFHDHYITNTTDANEQTTEHELYQNARNVLITNGLHYNHIVEDRQTVIAFDRSQGRAYTYHTTR